MAVVYQHRRMDDNTIFYIGIGTKTKRAYSDKARSEFWHNIVKKAGGYVVEFLFENLSWEEACNQERDLINRLGRRDLGTGLLVNLTEGGDGIVGLSTNPHTGKPSWSAGKEWPEEQKIKLRNSRIKSGNTSSCWKGKKRDDSFKSKLSQAASKYMWITDGNSNKRVLKDCEIPLGWMHGRFNKRTKYKNEQEARRAQIDRARKWKNKNKIKNKL